MIVEYDEKLLDNEIIINAVGDAGYKAIESNNEKSSNKKQENNKDDVIKSMKNRLIVSIIFWILLMYIAMHNMFYDCLGLPIPKIIRELFNGNENAITFGFTQILLLVPIIFVNRNYFIIGFKRLLKRTPNMDSLIAIGSTAAIIYGVYAIYMIGYGLGHNKIDLVEKFSIDLYLESAGTILTLITVGKYLETKSKGKTSDAISKLISLAPKTAILLKDSEEVEVKLEDIKKDDVLIIKPGMSIPVDGIVIDGSACIDQSTITGESIPVEKNVRDKVVSGTINKTGYFKMQATRIGEDTTLSQIIKLVEEASSSKAPIARLADKVSGVFVPIVITIALLAFIFWILNGQSFEFAFGIGIAVLVISCPCALGLATPVAIMVGTGKGAENGILFKSAESLELLYQVNTVILDKTGTITEGKPKVIELITNQTIMNEIFGGEKIKVVQNKNNSINAERNLLMVAGSLEKASEHPLADAIIEKANQENIELKEVKAFTTISGRGIKGKINEVNYYGGNLAFMKENNINTLDFEEKANKLSKQGKICLYFAKENKLIGIIVVADTIKNTSKKAIEDLKKKNIEVAMITGDNKLVAEFIGKELNIDKVIAEVMPQDKEKEVLKLQSDSKKVAFVGDGINDSPALVRADVGIAIGSGTDIAIESADVVLMKNSLLEVNTAINLSKAVINNIKMNLFWAFFYNAIGIPIAAGVFYLQFGLKLNPMLGAAMMSLSSVCVVTNALRLRNFKSKSEVNLKNDKMNNLKENKIMKKIYIEGMQCNHCKMTVEKELGKINGVTKVEVNLENKNAIIEFNKEIDNKLIEKVIKESGFEVTNIE